MRLILGDSLAELRKLPSESVHCCVTSPPYWGLRDYGTARWEGGDADCNHLNGPLASPRSTLEGYTSDNVKLALGGMPFREVCGRCGARRIDSQLGLERTPEEYVANMVEVFREVRRVLRNDGTLWLNLGDSYNAYNGNAGPGPGFSYMAACDTERPHLKTGHGLRTKGLKPKDLVGIPWRVAFALQADGWWLRQDIIWAKPNPMPESVTDRCTKSHEYVFLMAKSQKYYYDAEAIKEDAHDPKKSGKDSCLVEAARGNNLYRTRMGLQKFNASLVGLDNGKNFDSVGDIHYQRNRRSVWTITTKPFKGAHFATFPPEIPEICIKAGCPKGGVVLDPFFGAGTVGVVALNLGREFIGIELNQAYCAMAEKRIKEAQAQEKLF